MLRLAQLHFPATVPSPFLSAELGLDPVGAAIAVGVSIINAAGAAGAASAGTADDWAAPAASDRCSAPGDASAAAPASAVRSDAASGPWAPCHFPAAISFPRSTLSGPPTSSAQPAASVRLR